MSLDTLNALRAGRLAGATQVRLNGCGLTALPEELRALAPTLEVLDVGHNPLGTLPPWLAELPRLQVLFASYTPLTVVPEVLGACTALRQIGLRNCQLHTLPAAALPPRLRWLTLTANALSSVPAALGDCAELEKLMLSGNRLAQLPASLAGLSRLALLRVAANGLIQWPGWVGELPALAWLAVAGNPWCDAAPPATAAPATAATAHRDIPWTELTLGAVLGQGAGGTTWQARWTPPGGPGGSGCGAAAGQDVAVKVFGGAITSDGTPATELAASLCPGPHPQLTSALGAVSGHPEGASALVMPLLPARLRPLAGPPSLASCSRDVYDPALRLCPADAHAVAAQAAAALAHLHAHGVLHGDVYAHNLLWAPADPLAGLPAQAVLSDLGAALRWPHRLAPAWPAVQRLEVLALGHLLDELALRLDGHGPGLQAQAAALRRHWAPWQAACREPVPARRPAVAEVAAALARPPA
ncbi:leucine-rich repeat domain-containing protein [Ideonella livida]|uniref:Leucine-rich repeat domain-containing protein n=1 Tax=Ideonella livida TaxID=2707176 RepID=A0A7C9TIW2_9BURK|nr:leucine-rich repeat domain-containing protein [Ideonella livida]NDY91338.1 leucine-rich repeat domain-containing protein [Ideonella livida]